MGKEIIFVLVLAILFLGAIAWLVIYSRLQHRKTVRVEERSQTLLPAEASARPRSNTSARRMVTR